MWPCDITCLVMEAEGVPQPVPITVSLSWPQVAEWNAVQCIISPSLPGYHKKVLSFFSRDLHVISF